MKLLRAALCLSVVLASPGASSVAFAADVVIGAGAARTLPVLSVKTAVLPQAELSGLELKTLENIPTAPTLAAIPQAETPRQALKSLESPQVQAAALAPTAKAVAPVLASIARPQTAGEAASRAGEDAITILQGGRVAGYSGTASVVSASGAAPKSAFLRRPTVKTTAARSLPKAFFAGAALTLGTAAGGGLAAALVALPMMVVSFVLHEVAHARAAYLLGDPGPILDNRASLKPRDWKTHFDPMWTLVVPVATLLASHGHALMGGANPVEFESDRFAKTGPLYGAAIAGFAGPAVNLVLAGIGAALFAAATAAAAPVALVHAAGLFAVMNAGIAVFNLLPFYPLDGHFVAYAAMPKKLAEGLKRFYKTSGVLAWVPAAVFMGVAMKFGLGLIALHWIAKLLLGAAGSAGLGL